MEENESEGEDAFEVAVVVLDSKGMRADLVSTGESEGPHQDVLQGEEAVYGSDVEQDGSGREGMRDFGVNEAVAEKEREGEKEAHDSSTEL